MKERMTSQERLLARQVGALIRSKREKRGLCQSEMAERVGISQGALSRYERGQLLPSFFHMLRLREELRISLARFKIPEGPI
jgi:transcriptional regulator with XRE-family HTH domain